MPSHNAWGEKIEYVEQVAKKMKGNNKEKDERYVWYCNTHGIYLKNIYEKDGVYYHDDCKIALIKVDKYSIPVED